MMNRNDIMARLGRVSGFAVLAAVGIAAAACDFDEILEVTDPETVSEETLDEAALLPIIVNGAIGDFIGSWNGGDAVVTVTGVMTDEFFSSGTFGTRTATDRRLQFDQGNTSDGPYNDLHQARRALREAAIRLAASPDFGTGHEDYTEVKSLEGYALIGLGENFCSGVPLSFANDDGTFSFGVPLTTAAILDTAIAKFDAALAGAPDANLPAVGKGRALLALGDYAGAAAAVANVPTDFSYFVTHSSFATDNAVYSLQRNGRYSQSEQEGGNGLPYRSTMDPRTPWEEDPDGGFDEAYRLFLSLKYNDFSDPIVLASGVEARLIEAEAALQGNDLPGMTAILNALRADVATIMAAWVPGYADIVPSASLPALATPASQAAAVDLLFEERGFWFYLTGHRLADMRRLVYQYGRAPNTVYPTGTYHKGGTYGPDVVFRIPFEEENNENFTSSICDVTSAAID